MTRIDITSDDGGIRIGMPPSGPERTAVVEARGALLLWDVLTDDVLPCADVWDVDRAQDWLWEIYGPDVTAALATGATGFEAASGPTTLSARSAARASWAPAWWPASYVANVPALDLRLVAAEAAVALADIEHLLDDQDEAVGGALDDAAGCADVLHRLAADPSTDPVDASAARALRERVNELAEDHGIDLSLVPVGDRADVALAAAGTDTPPGIALADGTDPLDLALVPARTVDAAADVSWRIVRRGPETVLEVSVPRAPSPPGAPEATPVLRARFGTVELDLTAEDAFYAGEAVVPPAVLLLPSQQRTVSVAAPGYRTATEDGTSARHHPVDTAARDALVAHARARPQLPSATVSEREAARRRSTA